MKRIVMTLSVLMSIFVVSEACTSAIVSARLTKSGRAIVWKNRDTGVEDNFIAQSVSPEGMKYVGLYNAGDSLLRDAWAGFNEAGFVIMNTASYNLAPDTASFVDQEGYVMRRALSTCRTLADFEALLDTIAKPIGIQANFGVMDAEGNGAYYEADDFRFTKFDLSESDEGFIVRTNYSHSGVVDGGYGYIREQNALSLLRPNIDRRDVAPSTFTDGLSRSFYHSLLGKDMSQQGEKWIVDQDFIPRYTSTASVAFELPAKGEPASAVVMWVALGYPPCSWTKAVTIDNVPPELTPDAATWHSPFCDEVVARKHEVFPIKRGSGSHYIYVATLNRYNSLFRNRSFETYSNYERIHKSLVK